MTGDIVMVVYGINGLVKNNFDLSDNIILFYFKHVMLNFTEGMNRVFELN